MRDLNRADVAPVDRIDDDTVHLQRAYKHFKKAMQELYACTHLEAPIIRAMRLVYEVEDVLWQYTKK